MSNVQAVTLATRGVELVALALKHEAGLRAGEWPEVKAQRMHLLNKQRPLRLNTPC